MRISESEPDTKIRDKKTMPTKKAETKEVKTTATKTVKKEIVKKAVAPKVVEAKVASKKVAVKKAVKAVKTVEAPKVEVTEEVKEVKEVKVESPKVEEVKEEIAIVEVEKAAVVPGSAVTVEALFEAGAHFGHVVKKWNPKMAKYLWGAKNGIHIFDLEKTVSSLEEATKALTKAVADGKRIVVVGTKRQARPMVEEMAKRVGVAYLTQRWLGGLMTNWKQVKLSIERLVSLKQKREAGLLKKYTKKEQILFDKEISKLERLVGGLVTLKDTPQTLLVIDTHNERLAVREANAGKAVVIGLVDSNANPDVIDFPVPMNDDSTKALEIVIAAFENAFVQGKKKTAEIKK